MGPIFVVGNSRSGTTMLGKILGNHSQIYTFKELQFFEKDLDDDEMVARPMERERLIAIGERLWTSIEEGVFSPVIPGRYRDTVVALLARDGIDDPMALYVSMLAGKTRAAGKSIACEQTPRYLFVLDAILAAYPDARAVHIYRDPRAILLSQKNRWKRAALSSGPRRSRLWTLTSWSNYHPVVTSRFWVSAMRKMRSFETHPRFTAFSYEAMLSDPEATLAGLCDFLGIGFEPSMLDIPVEGSSTRHDEPGRRGIDKSRLGGWRDGGLSRAEIEICERVAGDEMTRLGYTLTGWRASLPARVLAYGTLLPKAVAAIALNFRRFSNIFTFLKRRLQ